jgi:transcriptional antiterminator Rof (Rho-off)
MTNKLRSLVIAIIILLIFFSVNISYAGKIQFNGKIKTATGQEYEGKITAISTTGNNESIKVLYQGNVTYIRFDQLKAIESSNPEKKELTFEFKTGKKYVVNTLDRQTPLFEIYIEQDIGKIHIANMKNITFYEILKTEK